MAKIFRSDEESLISYELDPKKGNRWRAYACIDLDERHRSYWGFVCRRPFILETFYILPKPLRWLAARFKRF